MQLGFVSAILGELSLEEVLAFAAEEEFGCVELMCWPPGGGSRRYAGVCHIDASHPSEEQAHHIRDLLRIHGVRISGLGYYPNPLDGNEEHRTFVGDHLKKVIRLAQLIGVNIVNTFIGRDHTKNLDENWEVMKTVWPSILAEAEQANVRIGIENCPMLFSKDEWPGGKNLATTPAIWRRLFTEFPTPHLGLNFDPSHLIWQFIDPEQAIRDFGSRFVHIHAKDTRINRAKLQELGSMAFGWHVPKLPGLGDVNWGAFFAALTDIGFQGAVCIEVEDRAFEGSVEERKRALRQSKRYLAQFMS